MTTAAIVYRSATGTTRGLAQEIGEHLAARGLVVSVSSVSDCDPASLAGADIVLLGCWTSGLLVVGQHPDKPWLAFVRDLPELPGTRVGLFTTYKIRTGSMFPRMRSALGTRIASVDLELTSRDAHLPADGRAALDRFIEAGRP